jgi:hypothetical protein
MKRLKTFNQLNESTTINLKEEVDNIIETILDFLDEGYQILFASPNGSMAYSDYLQKNEHYNNFKPINKAGNKIISKFSIQFNLGQHQANFEKLTNIFDEMKATIGRLNDLGWILSNMQITPEKRGYGQEVLIRWVDFTYKKNRL